jgi:nucleotide-binding universal stress UspA family protein
LRVLLAYEWSWLGGRYAAIGELEEAVTEQIADLEAEAVGEVVAVAPGITVTTAAVDGGAAHVLIEASGTAALLVVGNRGRGGFASLLAGSVSQQVSTHALCPVVVVRGRGDRATGPIVVGVDGSASAEHALGLAFEQAAARNRGVVAIRAFPSPVHAWGVGVPLAVYDDTELRAAGRRAVEDSVAGWHEKYPRVPAEARLADGHPIDVLVDASHDAQLVVVGTRGHGGFGGTLLGSVGLALVHHADCPVLVARSTVEGPR